MHTLASDIKTVANQLCGMTVIFNRNKKVVPQLLEESTKRELRLPYLSRMFHYEDMATASPVALVLKLLSPSRVSPRESCQMNILSINGSDERTVQYAGYLRFARDNLHYHDRFI